MSMWLMARGSQIEEKGKKSCTLAKRDLLSRQLVPIHLIGEHGRALFPGTASAQLEPICTAVVWSPDCYYGSAIARLLDGCLIPLAEIFFTTVRVCEAIYGNLQFLFNSPFAFSDFPSYLFGREARNK